MNAPSGAPQPAESERGAPHSELRFRVRWHECDPQGVIFNAHYLAFCDMAYTELWRNICGSYQGLVDLGYETVIAESTVKYLASGHYDEEIVTSARISHLGQSALVVEYEILREDTCLAQSSIRYVFLDAETGLKVPVQGEARELVSRFA